MESAPITLTSFGLISFSISLSERRVACSIHRKYEKLTEAVAKCEFDAGKVIVCEHLDRAHEF